MSDFPEIDDCELLGSIDIFYNLIYASGERVIDMMSGRIMEVIYNTSADFNLTNHEVMCTWKENGVLKCGVFNAIYLSLANR